MTVYTALPTDDLNLAVEVTESNDMVTINITPAIVNTGGGGGSGTVTNVATGTGLTGGPITTTGTIAIDSTVATLTGTQTLTNKSGAISQWTNDVNFLSTSSDANALADINYTTTPTEGQVLGWDNANQYWEPITNSGGGGATDLNSLTDVTITSVQNNDLLMYNSVATKWQNTNLGVSVTPTLTGNASGYTGQPYTLTVSNNATYQDPAYFVEVYTGATLVVANSAVTDNGNGTLTFNAPATGTHEIRVRCQDFGDLQSEIATKALTTALFEFNYRYFRLLFDAPIGSGTLIPEFAFYTAPAQGGTKWPTSAMTTNSLPVPFVAYGQGAFGANYDYWKAFDNGAGQYWNLSGTDNTDYLAIDFGSAQAIQSFKIRTAGFVQASMQLQASATGLFGGEEVVIQNITPTANSTLNIG
tara:strand:+ start:1751 stop:2998 length:1248 start_codon:yes stop_codon:yes gene_type:complete